MDRKNGTCLPAALRAAHDPIITYREFAPGPELRGLVRAFFSFVPGGESWRSTRRVLRERRFAAGESFCSPVFAAATGSLVFELGAACRMGTGWTLGAPVDALAIGALRTVAGAAGDARPAMLGAYVEPGATAALFDVPAVELTDCVLPLDQLWGSSVRFLAADLPDLSESLRIDMLEAALRERWRHSKPRRGAIDVAGLAHWVHANASRMTVQRMAQAVGVSRRHLTRVFRDVIGVSPKRFCRLARFHAGLACVGSGPPVNWAQTAQGLGYADQSHMIAEFREFSGLTPDTLAKGSWFHPFILAAGRSDESRWRRHR